MALSQLAVDQLKRFGYLFYVAPSEDLFVEKLEDKKAFTVEVSSLGRKRRNELREPWMMEEERRGFT